MRAASDERAVFQDGAASHVSTISCEAQIDSKTDPENMRTVTSPPQGRMQTCLDFIPPLGFGRSLGLSPFASRLAARSRPPDPQFDEDRIFPTGSRAPSICRFRNNKRAKACSCLCGHLKTCTGPTQGMIVRARKFEHLRTHVAYSACSMLLASLMQRNHAMQRVLLSTYWSDKMRLLRSNAEYPRHSLVDFAQVSSGCCRSAVSSCTAASAVFRVVGIGRLSQGKRAASATFSNSIQSMSAKMILVVGLNFLHPLL